MNHWQLILAQPAPAPAPSGPSAVEVGQDVWQVLTQAGFGWVVALSVFLFAAVGFVRGDFGFAIPGLTPWLKSLPRAATFVVVLVLSMALGGIGATQTCGVGWDCFVSGIPAGLLVGLGAGGWNGGLRIVKSWFVRIP